MGRRKKADSDKASKVTISFTKELKEVWEKTDKSFLVTVLLKFANTFDNPKDATDIIREMALEREANKLTS